MKEVPTYGELEARVQELERENATLKTALREKLPESFPDLREERDALQAQVTVLREAVEVHLIGLDQANRRRHRAVSFQTWAAIMRGAEDLRTALAATALKEEAGHG